MLIPLHHLPISKSIKGIIHIGAHECEERDAYMQIYGIGDDKTIWVDALENKVNQMKTSLPNVKIFNECVSDKDGDEVSFMITSNYQSSSMLNFKTHAAEHPHVTEIGRVIIHTKTLNTIFAEQNLNPLDYNFMNLDIQGAELMALKGYESNLHSVDYIYMEVNEKELYEGCPLIPEVDEYLGRHGFKRIMTKMTQYGWGDAFYGR